MGEWRTLAVALVADPSGYSAGIAKAERDTVAFGRTVEGSTANAGQAWETMSKKVSTAGGLIAIGAGLIAKSAGGVASAAEEAGTKADVVFGAAAGSVRAFAEDAQDSYGLSNRAALDYAGTLGNLLVSQGTSQQSAADMSLTLVKLASDLASFNNTSISDALDAIRSGLVGEQEPLRRFGIAITDVALRQEAMALGLDATGASLDANVRQQAAYSLMLKQSKTAQGDFARTSEGLANQQRILSAEWENSQEKLGRGLVPAMKAGVSVASDMLSVFDLLPSGLQAGAVAALAFGGAFVFIAPKVLEAAAAIDAVRVARAAAAAGTVVETAATGASVGVQVGYAASVTGTADALMAKRVAALQSQGAVLLDAQASSTATAANVAQGRSAVTAAGSLGKLTVALAAGYASYSLTTGVLQMVSDRYRSAAWEAGEFAAAVEATAASGQASGGLMARYGQDLQGLVDIYGKLNKDRGDAAADAAKVIATLGTFGVKDIGQANSAKEEFASLDQQLADMAAEGPTQAAAVSAAYGEIAAALIASGADAEYVANALFPKVGDALGDLSTVVPEVTDDLAEQTKTWRELASATFEAFSRQTKWGQSQRAATDAISDYQAARRAAYGDSDQHRAAEEAVADAYDQVSDASRGVVDAERGVADARRGVVEAERAITDALRDARRAQEDLNDAREEAADRLVDLRFAERDSSLSVREAELRLRQAREEAFYAEDDPTTAIDERLAAQLALERAQLSYEQAQQRATDATDDRNEAERQGIEGSDLVVSAQERVAAAQQGVTDARMRLTDAEQGVADAQLRVADAQEAVADANLQVIEAQKELFITALEAQEKLTETRDAAADAIAAMAEASVAAGAAPQVIIDKLREAANRLAPGDPLRQRLLAMIAEATVAVGLMAQLDPELEAHRQQAWNNYGTIPTTPSGGGGITEGIGNVIDTFGGGWLRTADWKGTTMPAAPIMAPQGTPVAPGGRGDTRVMFAEGAIRVDGSKLTEPELAAAMRKAITDATPDIVQNLRDHDKARA